MTMKKIIAALLVVVMSALCLTACGYSYTKDEMSNYATFDKEAFFAALQTLSVEDADFGTDEDARQQKVLDKIFTTLAGKADADAKNKEGVPAKYDTYYYCYYCTATIDGKEVILFASNMKESGATKLQLGMSTLEGLNKDIANSVVSVDIKDYLYATNTENKTEANDTVYVSYVKEYEAKVLDDEGNPTLDKDGNPIVESVKTTVSYEEVVVGIADGSTFADKLCDQPINASNVSFELKETIDGEEKTVKYSSVKVNWIVDSKTELGTFTDKTYTTDKKVKDVYNVEYNLKDVELTYHVFPVYYLSVTSELTADVVIFDLLAGKITKDSLECFSDETLKNGDETITAIVEELATLLSALDTAKTNTESAQKKYDEAKDKVDDAGDKVTNAQKNNLTTAEKALKEAQEKEAEAKTKAEEQAAKLYGCSESMKDTIVEDYKKSQYESLENSYKSSLANSLANEIYALAKKYITYKTEGGVPVLPKKAVNDAYNRLENNYKYTFYEGTYDDNNENTEDETNYKHYNGDLDAYLKAALGLKTDATMQQVYDAIGAKAEQSVKDLILVYTLAELYGETVAVTDEDIDTFKQSFTYILLVYQYGEENVHKEDFIHAIQLDNVLDYLLTEKKDYEGNTVQYEHIKYEFVEESES